MYIAKPIANIDHKFPELHLTSLFGYVDQRNVHLGNPGAILEIAKHFHMDGAQLWSQFLVYTCRSFAKNLHLPSGVTPIHAVSKALLAPAKKETTSVFFPPISDLLATLVVLPAEVERLFRV